MKTLFVSMLIVLCVAGCSSDNPVGPASDDATVMVTGTLSNRDGETATVRFMIGYSDIERLYETSSGDQMSIFTGPVDIANIGFRNAATDILGPLDGRSMQMMLRRSESGNEIQGSVGGADLQGNTYNLAWRVRYQGRIADDPSVLLDDVFGAPANLALQVQTGRESVYWREVRATVTVRGMRKVVERSK